MVWITFMLLATVTLISGQERSFTIDYNGNQFLMDGEPFRYISGSMHYFRTPSFYWRDRLRKMRAAGLNAVQTYIEWSFHEPWKGVYDFDGDQDFVEFIRIAQEEDLYVILRPGPYICAERDMGGFPFWLLKENSTMTLRSNNEAYMGFVETWLRELLPRVKPLLYHNGGPIIMVQVENEYGSYFTCDFDYTRILKNILQDQLGEETLLFTTDGAADSYLKCGKIADVYATVDFGPGGNVTKAFHPQRNHEPRGPLVNSEFYAGWLDHWGEPHANTITLILTRSLDHMLALNASVNIYMFHGGTNFGFTAGANMGSFYTPDPTSYDYDAPLNEAGDPTNKYYSIRDVIGKYVELPPDPVPAPTPKAAYGDVPLTPAGTLFEARRILSLPPSDTLVPATFEDLGVHGGLVVYETTLTFQPTDPALLTIKGIRDRAYVFVDQEYFGVLSRSYEVNSIPIVAQEGQKLQIIVESQGRINYGSDINDFKGIVSEVILNNYPLLNWTQHPFPLNDTRLLYKYVAIQSATHRRRKRSLAHPNDPMSFYTAGFVLPEEDDQPMDTFLRLDNWHKGVVFINGHNVGRYWPKEGPQQTLFVPASFLVPPPEYNRITLLEYQRSPCITTPEKCFVSFVAEPVLDGKTPTWPLITRAQETCKTKNPYQQRNRHTCIP